VLASGSTVEMVLDRPVSFSESEINFNGFPAVAPALPQAPRPHGSSTARTPWPR